MNWILVLSLSTNPSGNYVREFADEAACQQEMYTLISNSEQDANSSVKMIACVAKSSLLAMQD